MQNPNQLSSYANIVLKYGVPNSAAAIDSEGLADLLVTHPILASRRTHTMVLGRELNGNHDDQLLSYLQSDALVPDTDALQIIAHKDIWTPEREERIQQHLPSVVAFVTRIITPAREIETIVAKYDDGDYPESTTSYVSIPIDQLFDTIVDEIVKLPGLDTLILLAPLNPATFLTQEDEFQKNLLNVLRAIKTLKKAVVPLDFFAHLSNIIEALKEHGGLTFLELAMPSTFDLLSLDPVFQRLLEVDLLVALEPFSQLEELVVGRDLLTSFELFEEMGQRMFNTRLNSADGQTVFFKDPARDLMYGNSALPLGGI